MGRVLGHFPPACRERGMESHRTSSIDMAASQPSTPETSVSRMHHDAFRRTQSDSLSVACCIGAIFKDCVVPAVQKPVALIGHWNARKHRKTRDAPRKSSGVRPPHARGASLHGSRGPMDFNVLCASPFSSVASAGTDALPLPASVPCPPSSGSACPSHAVASAPAAISCRCQCPSSVSSHHAAFFGFLFVALVTVRTAGLNRKS